MDLKTDYNNYLEEIRKESEKEEIKLILADKLDEDGFDCIARMVRWFIKERKWPSCEIINYWNNSSKKKIKLSCYEDRTDGLPEVYFHIIGFLLKSNIYSIGTMGMEVIFDFENELLFLDKISRNMIQANQFMNAILWT